MMAVVALVAAIALVIAQVSICSSDAVDLVLRTRNWVMSIASIRSRTLESHRFVCLNIAGWARGVYFCTSCRSGCCGVARTMATIAAQGVLREVFNAKTTRGRATLCATSDRDRVVVVHPFSAGGATGKLRV